MGCPSDAAPSFRRQDERVADPTDRRREVAALLEPLFPLRSDRTAPERYALVLADGGGEVLAQRALLIEHPGVHCRD